MIHRHYKFTPAAASTTRFASSVSGSGPFTLTNTKAVDYDAANVLAHKLTMTGLTATDLSGINVVWVGTDADGQTITETTLGPVGTATVTTVNNYATLISVTPASSFGAAVKIGNAADSVSMSYHVSFYQMYPDIGFSVILSSSSITYDVQDNLADTAVAGYSNNGQWLNHTTVNGKTASTDGSYTYPISGIRIHFSAADGTSTAKFNIIQGPEC